MRGKCCLLVLAMLVAAILCISSCSENESSSDEAAATDERTQIAQDVDMSAIAGEYQAVEQDNGKDEEYVGGYWHLDIYEDEQISVWYLSIYDNEAGNRGIYGPILDVGQSTITVAYDPDYYEEMPSSKWKIENEGTTDACLQLEYKTTSTGIELTNNGKTIQFNT